ncbi:hypothetical protein [Aeromicrobium sp. HA]|uniref:hypothetical protein n=1 Tax=Aeromicrobium sp. HA TaxID=3009077 RepID=UPI0022AFD995|nr:hypothetical protein [Aeromicrobium sp. HA]
MNTMVRRAALALLALIASLLIAPVGAAQAATAGTVSGTITASPGVPTGDTVWVQAQRRLPSGHWVRVNRATSTTVGRTYSLPIAEAGTYRVQAQVFGESSSDFRTVSVSGGVKRTGVHLRLMPDRTISGDVTTDGFRIEDLDLELPLMVAADTTDEPSWSTEVAAQAQVANDGSFTLSVPHPYDEVRIRYYQRPCPDDPAAPCALGSAADVRTAFWDGSPDGAPTFAQATPIDLTSPSTDSRDATLRLAAKFTSATAPRISGTPRLGATLTAQPGSYAPAANSVVYEWYAGSAAVLGEYDSLVGTGRTFKVTSDVIGDSLMVRARPIREGYEGPNPRSAYVLAKSRSTLAVKAKPGHRKATFTVRVKAPGLSSARIYGKASVYAKGKRIKTVTVRNGKATIKIARQKKGKRTYTVRWSGNESITPAAKSLKVTIR